MYFKNSKPFGDLPNLIFYISYKKEYQHGGRKRVLLPENVWKNVKLHCALELTQNKFK
jgi:hypothetical protein